MKIEDTNGRPITNLAEWAEIYSSPRSSHQWKEHRSAYSTAEFFLNRDGVSSLKTRIENALGENVEFEKAIPEFEVRFDQFGRGRMHDMAIFGETKSGKSIFVGLEAKVDEPFGSIVRDEYLTAKAKQIAGKSTNAPERIENLLKLHFSEPNPDMFDVRYQLLYATLGTLAAGADISILYVIVFKTQLYDEVKSAENYRDYVQFMVSVGAEPLKLSNNAVQGHKILLQGKELICLYEYFDL
jgi:hypothetical protein